MYKYHQFDYATIMQPNTVVHAKTESEANELLYWAEQQGVEYLTPNSWQRYKQDTYYNIYANTFGTIAFCADSYTILTMDEARIGKQILKEQPRDKPLLSDLLKQHGAYEKFLANLSIASPNYNEYGHKPSAEASLYVDYLTSQTGSSKEETYWNNIADSLANIYCINDVRAPDDIEYWQEQYAAGKEVFVYEPSTEYVCTCNFPPNALEPETQFYAELPTWLEQGIPTTKEQTMVADKPTKFKVGDSICTEQDAEHYLVIGIDNEGYLHQDNLDTSFEAAEKLYELVTSAPATTETSEPTIPKEDTMIQLNQELAEAIAKGISAANCKPTKCKAAKTDFEARKPITAVFYNKKKFGGNYLETAYFNKVSQADDHLQSMDNPNRIKMVVHHESEVISTKLTLSRTKSK